MKLREIRNLVESTGDAAFAVDRGGIIVASNKAAAEMLGMEGPQMLGKRCGSLIKGKDECGPVCGKDCVVLQTARSRRRIGNFDLQIETRHGPRWCNVSVLIADEARAFTLYSIHIIRPIDVRKRLEMLVRDFVVTRTGLPDDKVTELIRSSRAPVQANWLTTREVAVLCMLAKGQSSDRIAGECHISRTTVNNHIQHILRKMDAHTRLEAIRKAERAGII
ncbi:MAG: PAS domain-containing protein [Betaproteobacteria bacterium]|nr:PAS domain-containing protein [Betaproteobacteria bacterium]